MSNKKLRLSRKLKNLCVECGSEKLQTKTLCENCNLRLKLYNKERKEKCIIENRCFKCSSNINVIHGYCKICIDKKNLDVKNRYHKRVKEKRCRYCGDINNSLQSQCIKCFYKKVSIRYLGSAEHWNILSELMEKQKFTCAISGDLLLPGVNVALDHIVPKSKGGLDDINNFQWVTKIANFMKYNQTMEEMYSMCEKILIQYKKLK